MKFDCMLSPGEGGLYLAILILLAIAGIFTIGGGEDDFEEEKLSSILNNN